MGGRLDAVNVVDADVAVVVSIGFDHMEFLGDTLEAIGAEKAGIFRPGKAAVLGSRAMPRVVEARAVALGAKLKRLGAEFDYSRNGAEWSYRGPQWDLRKLPPPALRGDTQYDNAATAIAALEALQPAWPVPDEAVRVGLRSVRLVGRFQVYPGDGAARPTWILDVAHNPDAARVLADNLRALPSGGRTLAVCGILADKDAAGIVAELRSVIDEWIFVSMHGERGIAAESLAARVAARLNGPMSVQQSIAAACEAAFAAAGPRDRIVVFGSFHTVGPALDWLESKGSRSWIVA